MAMLTISISQEDLKLCKDLIETICRGLIETTKDDPKAFDNIINAYATLHKLLKLGDVK